MTRRFIRFVFLSIFAYLIYYSVVHIACGPESSVSCPLEHPLAESAAAYLDKEVKPHAMKGYEAVFDFYEKKALPVWNDTFMPFWEEKALPAWENALANGKTVWVSKVSPFWKEKVVGNWDKHAAPHWEQHVVRNWNKFAAPHWDKHVAGKTSKMIDTFGVKWPGWKSKGETFVREKWHSLAVFIVHDAVPYCYHGVVTVWEKSVEVTGKAWEKAEPIVEKGYAYIEKSVDNLCKTEAFIKVRESAVGKGVEEVYGVWVSGVRFIIDSVNCATGREEEALVCDKVMSVFSEMGNYVTGKKKQ
jgi:hypothetical protein